THARMRRHLEGPQLDQTKSSAAAVRRIKFIDAELRAMGVAGHVDEQVTEDAIDQPWRGVAIFGKLAKSGFDFVERIVPSLVDSRMLARRPDERAAEQKGKRWMILPVGNHAAQKVRPPQKRTLSRRGAPNDEMIPASRPHMTAINHEFLGAKP